MTSGTNFDKYIYHKALMGTTLELNQVPYSIGFPFTLNDRCLESLRTYPNDNLVCHGSTG